MKIVWSILGICILSQMFVNCLKTKSYISLETAQQILQSFPGTIYEFPFKLKTCEKILAWLKNRSSKRSKGFQAERNYHMFLEVKKEIARLMGLEEMVKKPAKPKSLISLHTVNQIEAAYPEVIGQYPWKLPMVKKILDWLNYKKSIGSEFIPLERYEEIFQELDKEIIRLTKMEEVALQLRQPKSFISIATVNEIEAAYPAARGEFPWKLGIVKNILHWLNYKKSIGSEFISPQRYDEIFQELHRELKRLTETKEAVNAKIPSAALSSEGYKDSSPTFIPGLQRTSSKEVSPRQTVAGFSTQSRQISSENTS